MKILMLAPRVPWPLHQGTAIRNYHIARQLALRHSVTLVAFEAADTSSDALTRAGVVVAGVPEPAARPFWRRLVDIVVTATPDLARRLDEPGMTATITGVLEDADVHGGFDVILVEGLEMSSYAISAAEGTGKRLVYDAHNAEWVLQHRAWLTDRRSSRKWHGAMYSLAQSTKLRRFENRLLGSAEATVAVSQRDAEALWQIAPGASIRVVPNGVDTTHYSADHPGDGAPTQCVFVGKMDFRPNIDAMEWFCADVWPRVVEREPEARLSIVGKSPVPRVRRLESDSVRVTGAVDDVRPNLAAAGVVVVPLRVGGGTRLKVLEAMAAGKAIAATTLAVEGLNVEHDRDALLADNAAELAEVVLRLVADSALRRRLGARARQTVEGEYDWTVLVPQIEQLLEES